MLRRISFYQTPLQNILFFLFFFFFLHSINQPLSCNLAAEGGGSGGSLGFFKHSFPVVYERFAAAKR